MVKNKPKTLEGIQSHIFYKVASYSLKGNVLGPPPRRSITAVRIFRIGCATGLTSPDNQRNHTCKKRTCLVPVSHVALPLSITRKKEVSTAVICTIREKGEAQYSGKLSNTSTNEVKLEKKPTVPDYVDEFPN